jgi:hypothetical protein
MERSQGYAVGGLFHDTPAHPIAEALEALGIFTPGGVRAVADVWGQLDFVDVQEFDDSRRLTHELLERLERERLFTAATKEQHVVSLHTAWQMPMYHFDFALVPVPLDELQPRAGVWLKALSTRLAIICARSSLSPASGSKTSRRVTSVLPSSSVVGANVSATSRVRVVTISAAFAAIKIGPRR